MKKTLFGIDYGNKYSGTTVICYNSFHQVRFMESSKNADADSFILSEANHLKPDLIFIDAPLSLPGVYWLGNGYTDHFFRSCDREMKAMSPMFLGGLTARAINLQKQLIKMGLKVLETYPRQLTVELGLPVEYYKRTDEDLTLFIEFLIRQLNCSINKKVITSWHHLDALLAFISGMRYLKKENKVFGEKNEGLVFV